MQHSNRHCSDWRSVLSAGVTLLLCAVLPLAVVSAQARYQKPELQTDYQKPSLVEFIRLSRGADGSPSSLDIALTHYRPISGAKLDVELIGAVHVGDAEYFQRLNEEFQHYEVLLYELVAPKDSAPIPDDSDRDFGRILQEFLPNMMGFADQLEEIDYRAENFVHADLSFEELKRIGKERGESLVTFAGGLLVDLLRSHNLKKMKNQEERKLGLTSTVKLMRNPKNLRVRFAEELVDERGITGFATLMPYLIDARNNAALAELDRQIAAGRTNIAIFYGAAHMPDFERKLYQVYGLTRTGVRWFKAWDLAKDIPKPEGLLNKLKRRLRKPGLKKKAVELQAGAAAAEGSGAEVD